MWAWLPVSWRRRWASSFQHLLTTRMNQDSIKTLTYLSYFAIYRASYGIPVQFICEIFFIVQARTKELQDLIRLESTLRYINEYSTDPAME